MQHLLYLLPIFEVVYRTKEVAQNHDIIQSHGHTAAGERVAHIPRVADEDSARFRVRGTLLDGWEERIGHPSQTVFVKRLLDGDMEGRRELGDDVLENMGLDN
jgi:hypothetical protein